MIIKYFFKSIANNIINCSFRRINCFRINRSIDKSIRIHPLTINLYAKMQVFIRDIVRIPSSTSISYQIPLKHHVIHRKGDSCPWILFRFE